MPQVRARSLALPGIDIARAGGESPELAVVALAKESFDSQSVTLRSFALRSG